MNNTEKFVNDMTSAIFYESARADVKPTSILQAVKTSFDNKLKLVQSVADNHRLDMASSIMYALEIETDRNPMCKCSVRPVSWKCKEEPVHKQGKWITDIIVPQPKKIHFSGDRTIVIWADGSKTVVKCTEGQEFDEYSGFVAALAKRAFGSTSQVKKVINTIGKRFEPNKTSNTEEETQDYAVEAVAEADVNIKNY